MATSSEDTNYHTYLYLHGLSLPRAVSLSNTVILHPVSVPPSADIALALSEDVDETAILLLFLPRTASELEIIGDGEESVVRGAWNALWDAMLLSAIFGVQVETNIQGECSANNVTKGSRLRVSNYYAHGLRSKVRNLVEEECIWLEENFHIAQNLLHNDTFMNSVHCLASYHWHPHPRSRLALLWAGIEGLFSVTSELSFRLSLYIAKFLEPSDRAAAKKLFNEVKRLYGHRSTAVHGGDLKAKDKAIVEQSALLLQRLIRQCIASGGLPDSDGLAF